MKVVKGDLIKMALGGQFDVIIHGCNCFHTMGGGIARQIRDTFPEVYEVDLRTIKGDPKKLGLCSYYTVPGRFTIVNAYTQFGFGGVKQNADYNAIRSCFAHVKCAFMGLRIAYPKIGAGLGGGDWDTISKIIDEELDGCDHTLVEYAP